MFASRTGHRSMAGGSRSASGPWKVLRRRPVALSGIPERAGLGARPASPLAIASWFHAQGLALLATAKPQTTNNRPAAPFGVSLKSSGNAFTQGNSGHDEILASRGHRSSVHR